VVRSDVPSPPPRRADDEPSADYRRTRYAPPAVALPAFIQPWAAILNTFGLPVALVIFFLAQNAGYIPSEQRQIVAVIQTHNTDMKTQTESQLLINKQLAGALERLAQETAESNRVVRAICASMGSQGDIRRACLGERGSP
jgi:hypothetical protein